MRILFLLAFLLVSCSSEEVLIEDEVLERIEIPAVFGEKSFVIEDETSQFNGDSVTYPDFFEVQSFAEFNQDAEESLDLMYVDRGSHELVSGVNWFYTRVLGEPIFVYAWEVEPELYQIFMFKKGENTLLYQDVYSYWTHYSLYLLADISGSGDHRVGFIQSKPNGGGVNRHISLQNPELQYQVTNGAEEDCPTQFDYDVSGILHAVNYFQGFGCNDSNLPVFSLDGVAFEHPFFESELPAEYSIDTMFFSPDLKVLLFNFNDRSEFKHYVATWNIETGEKEVYELFSHSASDITYGFERSEWLYDGQNFELQLTNNPEDFYDHYQYTLYPYDQVPYDSNETVVSEVGNIRHLKVTGDMWECVHRFETLAGEELALPPHFFNVCFDDWMELSPDGEYLYFTAWGEDTTNLYSYHFDSQKEEKLLSLYSSSEGINFFTWSPSGNRLAFEVVNQSAEDYPTGVKAFVLDLSKGKLVKKQKVDIEAFYSCEEYCYLGEAADFLFLDENTLQYRGATASGDSGELKTIQVE